MKKILAILTAAALLVCTGCRKTQPVPEGATMAVSLYASFKAEPIGEGYEAPEPCGDKILFTHYDEEMTASRFLYDPADGSFTEQTWAGPSDTYLTPVMIGDTVQILRQKMEGEGYQHSLLTFDPEMNLLSEETLDDALGTESCITAWTKTENGDLFYGDSSGKLYCQQTDGTVQMVSGMNNTASLFLGKDGSVYAAASMETLKVIDTDTMSAKDLTLDTPDVELPLQNMGGGYCAHPSYDFAFQNAEGIFGVDRENDTVTEILCWLHSDLDPQVTSTAFLPDGRIVAACCGDQQSEAFLMTARTQEEMDAMQLVSLVCLKNCYLDEMAIRFNRQSDNVRIVIQNIDPLDAFEKDLLDGIVPDMFGELYAYQSFSDKGLFEDLRPWFENDPEIHEEDYLFNFFEAMAYRGRIERISTRFRLASYIGKTKFFGGRTELSLTDLTELQAELPEGMTLLDESTDRVSAFQELMHLSLGCFVDYEKGECSFTSPEFIGLLELYGAMPEHPAVPDESAWKEDRVLLSNGTLYSLLHYQGTRQTLFGNADITLLGAPGCGGCIQPNLEEIAVSAQSKNKDVCWEFIKFLLSEENQSKDLSATAGFPVNLKALENSFSYQRSEAVQEDAYYQMIRDVYAVELPPASDEETDMLLQYLKGITSCTFTDTFVSDIVMEEAERYFGGDCTAEAAANAIQGRVSNYLSERA